MLSDDRVRLCRVRFTLAAALCLFGGVANRTRAELYRHGSVFGVFIWKKRVRQSFFCQGSYVGGVITLTFQQRC